MNKKDIEKLLKERYFHDGEKTWDDLTNRVSKVYVPIKEYLINKDFIFSSPTLMNFKVDNENGRQMGTLSSCFPMEIKDSLDDIGESVKEAMLVTKASGGVGYDFSFLRGSNEVISSFDRNSSGPISFIRMVNSVLEEIRQGGRRKGAGAAQMNIYHPNILDFVECKKDYNDPRYKRFNNTVRIPDSFMDVLKNKPNEIMRVQNVIDKQWHELKDNKGNLVTYKTLWDKIIHIAWFSAEPGIWYSDTAWKRFPAKNKYSHILMNPCQEHIGPSYSSCNLGSINMGNFIKNKKVDWDRLFNCVDTAVMSLNKIIDCNYFVLDKIKNVTLDLRPIGLGTMGWHNALIKMKIPYQSQEGRDFVRSVQNSITKKALMSSIMLSKKDGSYPAYLQDEFLQANEHFFKEDEELTNNLKKYGIRNSIVTNIAPTGTLSYFAQCSSGIEPIFALSYVRKIEKENNNFEEVYIVDKEFEKFLNSKYSETKTEILQDVVKHNGSCQYSKHLSEEDKQLFKTAGDMTTDEHLLMLQASALNVSTSVSKTVNLPRNATTEDVSNVYLKAHEMGIIGVTVYREGSREGVLITNKDDSNKKIVKTRAPKRPKELDAELYHVTLQKQKYYVTIGLYYDEPIEVFTGYNEIENEIYIPANVKHGKIIKQKSGQYIFKPKDNDNEYSLHGIHSSDTAEALTRQISLSLRHGANIVFIIDQLNKIKAGDMFCFSRILARTLKKYIPDNSESTNKCPVCSGKMVYEGGCANCKVCGHAACG